MTTNEYSSRLRKSKIAEFRARVEDIDAQLISLSEKDTLNEDEERKWDELTAEREVLQPELSKMEDREMTIQNIKARTSASIVGMPEPRKSSQEAFGQDVTRMDWRTARDYALRTLEDREQNVALSGHQKDHLDTLVRSAKNTDLARRIVVTENEHYTSAFTKLMTRGTAAVLSNEEHVAMLRYEEYRAASEGSNAGGGFAIPVFIDPSVILTDQETDNPFLTIARQVDVQTNAWKGVSAAGVSWSFDAEAAEVSDDAITIAQPSVTVFTARGFIPYSIEVGEDWPGFQAEMGRLLAEGYDELLISKFTNGNGTSEPRGIVTALDANTNVEIAVTTNGAFGQEDIYKVWKSLPQKYRRKASWMMSVDINNKIRQFGAANVYHAATVQLPAGAAEVLFNKPVYENAYMPDFVSSTVTADNTLVVGDFSNYVVARRTGMNVELVPQLFHTSNNRPSGQRGWFAYARIGGNSVNDLGFRLLQS